MKNNVSGSLKQKEVELESDKIDKESMNLLKKIFESDLFDTLLDKEMTCPEYLLHPPEAGFTDHWFFNAETKQLERFSRNKTVFVLSSYDKEKYLCSSEGNTYIIPKNLIKGTLEH